MAKRIITVRGQGKVSEEADQIVLRMTLKSKNYLYQEAMSSATKASKYLNQAVEALGFEQGDLKTTYFNIDTDYVRYKDENDQYRSRFAGYVIDQRLQLTFTYEAKRLGEVLKGIVESSADPELSISFRVKDEEGLKEKLLANAAKNARRRAEILTEASGAELGELLSIDYDWSEVHFHSSLNLESDMLMKTAEMPEIQPEDVQAEDTVVFRWEIK